MNINKLLENPLMGRTIGLLAHGMKFRGATHTVISGNMANIDTEGYKPKEIVFDEELQRAMDRNALRVKRTNPAHFSHYTGSLNNEDVSFTIRERKNEQKLNLDMEMSKMVQNNIKYEAYAKLLAKKFNGLREVIQSGGR